MKKQIDYKAAAKKGKHIFMPKKDAEVILATLRSGEVKQGNGSLFDGTGYCCLGVMQACKSGGKVEVLKNITTDELRLGGIGKYAKAFPSPEWLESVGWVFTVKAGRGDVVPYLPMLKMTAANANDHGVPFSRIADAMEAAIQYTD